MLGTCTETPEADLITSLIFLEITIKSYCVRWYIVSQTWNVTVLLHS